MKHMRRILQASSIALAASMVMPLAHASSHREAPAISLDPAADNTDVYAWVTPSAHDKLYIVANYNPLEEPSGGPNFHKFDDDVRYEIHIARGPDSLADAVTYYIFFKTKPLVVVPKNQIGTTEDLFNGVQFFRQIAAPPPDQSYSVVKVEKGRSTILVQNAPVAPPNIGPRTDSIVYKPASGTYDDAFAATFTTPLSDGGRVWAGPRDDGFYVDLGGIFDLADITSGRTAPVDGVAGFNVHSIVLEIPTNEVTGTGKSPTSGASDQQTLGIWAAASRRRFNIKNSDQNLNFGDWVQVSRLAIPLVNEALIGLQDKDKYNRTQPSDDLNNFAPYFLNPVIVRNAAAVGIYKELGVDDATVQALKHGPDGNGRFDIIDTINLKNFGGTDTHAITSIGDVLRVDLGIDSGFPNGRPLVGGAKPNQEQTDVTDAILTLLLSGGAIPISDHVNSNDKPFLASMPFLALPWQGFNQGHGHPAP